MTLFGKLLLFAQLVLSVCFMALAGAVYSTQSTWKQQYDTSQDQLAQVRTDLQAAEDAKNNAERERDEQVASITADRDTKAGQLSNLQTQLDALRSERDIAEANLERQKALAATNASEANFRAEESLTMRTVNSNLHTRLSTAMEEIRTLQDQKLTAEIERDSLQQNYITTAEELTSLRRQVNTQGLGTGEALAERVDPPPPIEGVISEVDKNAAGQVDLIAISLGSDDGLKQGQLLDAFRPSTASTEPRYLGKVQLVRVEPDRSVARVRVRNKNGIIERGDYVTSRL